MPIDRRYQRAAMGPAAGPFWPELEAIVDFISTQLSTNMQRDVTISGRIVRPLLKKHGFVRRKGLKKKSIIQSLDRNNRFERTQTRPGLGLTVDILSGIYETGARCLSI